MRFWGAFEDACPYNWKFTAANIYKRCVFVLQCFYRARAKLLSDIVYFYFRNKHPTGTGKLKSYVLTGSGGADRGFNVVYGVGINSFYRTERGPVFAVIGNEEFYAEACRRNTAAESCGAAVNCDLGDIGLCAEIDLDPAVAVCSIVGSTVSIKACPNGVGECVVTGIYYAVGKGNAVFIGIRNGRIFIPSVGFVLTEQVGMSICLANRNECANFC